MDQSEGGLYGPLRDLPRKGLRGQSPGSNRSSTRNEHEVREDMTGRVATTRPVRLTHNASRKALRLAGGRKRKLAAPACEQSGAKSAMSEVGELAVAGDDGARLAARFLEQRGIAQQIDRAEFR